MLSKDEREQFYIDPVIRFCYDYILPIDANRVLATHGDEISLITKDGEMICTYDSIQVPTYPKTYKRVESENAAFEVITEYVDNVLIIIQDGQYGLIDYDGEVILDPKYSVLRFVGPEKLELF